MYREGNRNVWTLESTYRVTHATLQAVPVQIAYARGYFDAEGGLPQDPWARFYIQLVQKDRTDIENLHALLAALGIRCGVLHNPSSVDPDYWRFYILASSQVDFISRIGSWHPRKRRLLEIRRAMARVHSSVGRKRSAVRVPAVGIVTS